MHLPLTPALTATSALQHMPVDNTSPSSSTPIALLQPRQEAGAPLPSSTDSVIFVTSTLTVTPSTTPTSIANPKPQPSKSSDSPSSVIISPTRSEPKSTIESKTETTTETKTSPATQESSTTESTSTTSTTQDASTTTPTATSPSTSTPPPQTSNSLRLTPTTTPPSPPSTSSNHTGLIVGLTLGSLFGLIALGLLLYWLLALRRGVNVCDCFTFRGRQKYQDTPLPERPLEVQSGQVHDKPLPSRPQMWYPMSGIGAAPRMEGGRVVGEGEGGMRLQRKPDLGARRELSTIPEF